VCTDERIARWRTTDQKPGPVMVGTPGMTGTSLDAVAEHRLYPMFHLMVFRGLRRGEVAGPPWSETNLAIGTVHISEQLVSASYEVREDTPKSDSGAHTVSLASSPWTRSPTNCSSCGGNASRPSVKKGTAPTGYGDSTGTPSPTSRTTTPRRNRERTRARSSRGRTPVPTTPNTCRRIAPVALVPRAEKRQEPPAEAEAEVPSDEPGETPA
jgi:hypothetical protein